MNTDIPNHASEHAYLNCIEFPLIKNNYIVISGCSGGGKSTLLAELANRGYSIVWEPGRQIVKEQLAIDGDALPWINLDKFLDLALSRYLFQFNSQKEQQHFVFFDRGIIDAVQLHENQPKYFQNAAEKFRYNRLVFLVPPWEEIFAQDNERQHDFEAAKKEFNELLIKYKTFDYQTILLPKVSVKERADFILGTLSAINSNEQSKNFLIDRGKQLLAWNKEKLTCKSDLTIDDLKDLFASEFIVIANGRKYFANYESYYDFLNKFRFDIDSIDYQVQEYLNAGSAVIMPLTATVLRTLGKKEVFDAILLIKFDELGKIIHWQEVYSLRLS
jgi:predicted ATPase